MAKPAAPATTTMYDRQGQAVEVPTGQAATAYRGGELTFAEGAPVYLQRGGKTVAVDGAQAAELLTGQESRFYSDGSAELARQEQTQAELGGISGGLQAGAAGLARGLTFGLSDVALSELGGDGVRQRLSDLREVRGAESTLGEGLGMLAPVVVSGGSGLLARGVTSGVRGAAALGAGVEAATGRALVGAGLREGGVLARGIATGAGQAAEQALYGAGSELSRQTLANEQISGEKLVAAAGLNALLGGAVGAGASFAASGARAAGARVVEAVGERGAALAEKVMPGGVEAYAAEKALKSTGGTQKQLAAIEAASPGLRARADAMLADEIPMALGRKPGAVLSREQMAAGLERVTEQEGAKIGDALKRLDVAGAEGPSLTKIAADARANVLAPLEANPFSKAEARAVRESIEALESVAKRPTAELPEALAPKLPRSPLDRDVNGRFLKGVRPEPPVAPGAPGLPPPPDARMGFEALHDLSSRLGKTIRKKGFGAERDALVEVRGLIEREIENAGEAAAVGLGDEGFAASYKAAKEGYAASRMLGDALSTGVARETSNASIGLREMLGAVSGSNVGSTIGGALGPAGSLVGGAVGGVASAYLNNLGKRYGDQVVANVLRSVAKGESLTSAATRVVDDVMGQKVRGFLQSAGSKAVGTLDRTARAALEAGGDQVRARTLDSREKRFDAARERVASIATSEADIAKTLPANTPPAVAASAQATAGRAAAFLQSKLPKDTTTAKTLTPHLSKARPSPEAQGQFLRYFEAVDDPTTVLADLERGTISREGVEAVKAVYPETYTQIQEAFQRELSERAKPLTYEQARDLGVLLGVVGHPAMDPSFIATIQETYAVQSPPQPPPATGRPINTARLYAEKPDSD